MTLLAPAIKIAQIVYKNRQTIYKVLIAQDKAIGGAYRKGGYGKATTYGVRTGAAAGGLIGSIISNVAEDTPGNGFQTPLQPKSTPRSTYQARGGRPRWIKPGYFKESKFDYCKRQPRYRFNRPSTNRFNR